MGLEVPNGDIEVRLGGGGDDGGGGRVEEGKRKEKVLFSLIKISTRVATICFMAILATN